MKICGDSSTTLHCVIRKLQSSKEYAYVVVRDEARRSFLPSSQSAVGSRSQVRSNLYAMFIECVENELR